VQDIIDLSDPVRADSAAAPAAAPGANGVGGEPAPRQQQADANGGTRFSGSTAYSDEMWDEEMEESGMRRSQEESQGDWEEGENSVDRRESQDGDGDGDGWAGDDGDVYSEGGSRFTDEASLRRDAEGREAGGVPEGRYTGGTEASYDDNSRYTESRAEERGEQPRSDRHDSAEHGDGDGYDDQESYEQRDRDSAEYDERDSMYGSVRSPERSEPAERGLMAASGDVKAFGADATVDLVYGAGRKDAAKNSARDQEIQEDKPIAAKKEAPPQERKESKDPPRKDEGAQKPVSGEFWTVHLNKPEGNLAEFKRLKLKGVGKEQNSVTTSKYNVFNFVFLNLTEQFARVANVYFLIIAALQLFTPLSPTGRYSTASPLAMVREVPSAVFIWRLSLGLLMT
jgi:hypothetical protein